MRNYTKDQIETALSNSTTYAEFRTNLEELGARVPQMLKKFPVGMKNWIRKLKYEISQDFSFGTPTTGHDIRQKKYYNRLEKMGHPDPMYLMNKQFG